MTDVESQAPSEGSWEERARKAREAREEPLGLFWTLVSGLLAVLVLVAAYGLIWLSPLLRYLPRLPEKKK